jgi:hypothetical protein
MNYLELGSHAAAVARSRAAIVAVHPVRDPADVTLYAWPVIDHPSTGKSLLMIAIMPERLTIPEQSALMNDAAVVAAGYVLP